MFADSPCRPTIAIRDKIKAVEFYRDVLGFKLVDANQPGASFACGGGTFLEIYPSEFAGTAKSTVAGFQVADLERRSSNSARAGSPLRSTTRPRRLTGSPSLAPTAGRGSRTLTGTPSRWSSSVRRRPRAGHTVIDAAGARERGRQRWILDPLTTYQRRSKLLSPATRPSSARRFVCRA